MQSVSYHRLWRLTRTLSLLVVTILLFGQSADAQRRRYRRIEKPTYTQEGWALSVGLAGFDYESDLIEDYNGQEASGLSLGFSYGFSPSVSLFANLTAGSLDDKVFNRDSRVGYLDFGLKASLSDRGRWRLQPYGTLSIGAAVFKRELDYEPDEEYYGGTARLAGGLDYFLSRSTVLFLELGIRGGDYERLYRGSQRFHLIDEPEFNGSSVVFGLRLKL